MHDIKWIRDNRDLFDERLGTRGLESPAPRLLELDEQRRAIITRLQAAQERRNAVSKDVGQAKAARDEARAASLIAEVGALKTAIADDETAQREVDAELDKALAEIPNLPLPEVPVGPDEHANVEKKRWGKAPALSFAPKQHFEIGEAWGLMDFEAAAKLSGARFVVLKGPLARMERALGQFMLDMHTTQHGYTEIAPPILVNGNAMFGTAQLPKFEMDLFEVIREFRRSKTELDVAKAGAEVRNTLNSKVASINNSMAARLQEAISRGNDASWAAEGFSQLAAMFEELRGEFGNDVARFEKLAGEFERMALAGVGKSFLIPTAEVPLTNLVRESILSEEELPLRVTALTPCFRAEAGAAGKDTRGLIRQHQFNKVELVSITTPEQSPEEHERMLASAEAVLAALGLHYRVVTLCTGDMGFASQKTYDIEVWLPGQNTFREISSCSTCGDFQARRMGARYRPAGEKTVRHVHTLNGSGVAVGRALVAVLENYQNEDGSVEVPEALRPYMGGLTRIEPAA